MLARIGVAILTCWLHAQATAACGDVSKQLFGIEIGGQRDKFDPPPGLTRYQSLPSPDLQASGIDLLRGKSQGISFHVQVFWHQGRVTSIAANSLPQSEESLEEAVNIIEKIAGLQFTQNQRDLNFYLNCSDGLLVLVNKGRGGFSSKNSKGIPVLGLLLEDPKLKNEMMIAMYCKDERQHCAYRVQRKRAD